MRILIVKSKEHFYLRKYAFILCLIITQMANGQNRADTIRFLENYSYKYLDLLFNKRDIDSAMLFWSAGIAKGLKTDYTNWKQECETDSMLKLLFTEDMKTFYRHVRGKIDFFAVDDKEGINIMYFTRDSTLVFLICCDFWGDFESNNLLMRSNLHFESQDKGKSWLLMDDSWIRNFFIVNYYKKEYYSKWPSVP